MAKAGIVRLVLLTRRVAARFCSQRCANVYKGPVRNVYDPEGGKMLSWEEASHRFGFCATCREFLAVRWD